MNEAANTICMYVPTSEGGHALYARELLHALSEQANGDYRFELVSCRDLRSYLFSSEYAIHPILPPLRDRSQCANRFSWMLDRALYYPKREWQFLRWLKGRPDIDGVHFQEWKPWLVVPMFRRVRAMGKKIFYTMHNILPHSYPPGIPHRVVHSWVRGGAQLCDGLFVHTQKLADELADFLGPRHPPIHVTPHGVWSIEPSRRDITIQEKLSWKRLLFFGMLRRNKGLDVLLEAAGELKDFSFTIAGWPDDLEFFEKEVQPRVARLAEAGVKIELIPRFIPQDEVGPLLARHSAIVLPYTSEFRAQSGVVYLAMAHELPVIATEAGGLRELFGECRLGVTFARATSPLLAQAVRELWSLEHPEELLEDIRDARERFSWASTARATLEGYSAAWAERRVPDDCAV